MTVIAPWVNRVARGFAALDRDEVEDVVQETFVRGFSRLATLRNADRFGPWMLAIARSRAPSRLASRRIAARVFERLAPVASSCSKILREPLQHLRRPAFDPRQDGRDLLVARPVQRLEPRRTHPLLDEDPIGHGV